MEYFNCIQLRFHSNKESHKLSQGTAQWLSIQCLQQSKAEPCVPKLPFQQSTTQLTCKGAAGRFISTLPKRQQFRYHTSSTQTNPSHEKATLRLATAPTPT